MNRNFDTAIILPFYGTFPIWVNAFLRSCNFNTELEWLIFSESKAPSYLPDNVQFIHLDKTDLSGLIYKKTGIQHRLDNPHKLCDFKPLYGHIFEEYIGDRTFWGHCDMDVIWGDMRAFLQHINYTSYDIISTRPHAISGHFTLYRNIEQLNLFYRQVPNYNKAFVGNNYQGFDEGFFSFHLFNEIQNHSLRVKPYWEKRNCLDRAELQRLPLGWYWKNGKIKYFFGLTGNYLHLIDWKHSLEIVELGDINKLRTFKITQFGLWKKAPSPQYQLRIIKGFELIHLFRHFKSRLKKFISTKTAAIHPNVPKEYRVLN